MSRLGAMLAALEPVSPDLRCFHDHVSDRRPRFEVRSRLYADTDSCSLEIKAKLADDETVKESLDLDPADHGRITPAARRFLQEHLPELLGVEEVPALEPSLITRFERADRHLRDAGIEPVSLSKYRVGIGLLAARDPEPPLGGHPERWFRPLPAPAGA